MFVWLKLFYQVLYYFISSVACCMLKIHAFWSLPLSSVFNISYETIFFKNKVWLFRGVFDSSLSSVKDLRFYFDHVLLRKLFWFGITEKSQIHCFQMLTDLLVKPENFASCILFLSDPMVGLETAAGELPTKNIRNLKMFFFWIICNLEKLL